MSQPDEPPDAGAPERAFSEPSPALSDLHARLERDLDAVEPSTLRDYHDQLVSLYLGPSQSPFSLAWPRGWFIPTEADYRQHWILPPPDANRYRYEFANTINGQAAGSYGRKTDGRLFAWVNVSDLRPGYTGFAGVGARLTPKATLSYVDLGADIDLVAESRWWFMPVAAHTTADVTYRGTVYLAAWRIDPVTGAWELVRPFASRRVINRRESGAGYSPVETSVHNVSDLAAMVLLEGGRSYAVTVSFEAEMSVAARGASGPLTARAPGDDVRLWASLTGTAGRITAQTRTVLVP